MTVAAVPRTIAPATPEEAAALLATCARENRAVVFSGGATLQSLGNAPSRVDVVLQTNALHGIADYDPRDMTAGIAAGTTLAHVSRALAEHRQWIPFDAPFPERATVGGTLAAGWAGPRRASYGRPRDLTLGSTIALTDGTLAHAGGMVVKNVTGYDMSKLYIGSLGTLGLITRANFKALPLPEARRLALAPIADDERERVIAAVGALVVEPVAALLIDGFPRIARHGNARVRLVLLFEGSAAVVDRATRDARSALGKAGVGETHLIDGEDAERTLAEIIDAYIETNERSLTYRAPGLPSTAYARTRSAAALAYDCDLAAESIADVRTGDAILRFSARTTGAFSDTLTRLDTGVHGTIERTTILAGAPKLRAAIDAWGTPPPTIATMRAIKAAFDPANVLAPGRYVGTL